MYRPTLPCSVATMSLAFCGPTPGSERSIFVSPISMALAYVATGMLIERMAPRGPKRGTSSSLSKKSRWAGGLEAHQHRRAAVGVDGEEVVEVQFDLRALGRARRDARRSGGGTVIS